MIIVERIMRRIAHLIILLAVAFVAVPSSSMAQSKLVRGDSGEEVEKLQQFLKTLDFYQGRVDGTFGAGTEKAVKAFQKSHGLSQDGRVGEQTWAKLNAKAPSGKPSGNVAVMPKLEKKTPRMSGEAVRRAQELLKSSGYKVTVDGVYGTETIDQVIKFQKDNGLPQDGKIGKATWAALTK